jgi:FYVE/RhoGEF/PH domain-containing protein 5/6
MQEPSGEGRQREFILFSDCLVWLESENGQRVNVLIGNDGSSLIRTRSKSEAELSVMRARYNDDSLPNPKRISVAPSTSSNPPPEEKWVFKGKAELVDLEIVIGGPEEVRFEILNPEGSFAVYAGTLSLSTFLHSVTGYSFAERKGRMEYGD